jgi:hypothetical protein
MSRIQDFNTVKSIVQKHELNKVFSNENTYYNDYEISFICNNQHTNRNCKVLDVLSAIKMGEYACIYCRPTQIECIIESYLNGGKRSDLVQPNPSWDIVHRSADKYKKTHPRVLINEFSFYIPSVNRYICWRKDDISPFVRFMKSFDNIEVWVFDKNNNLIDIEYSVIKK